MAAPYSRVYNTANLSHVQRVTRLYRKALKHSLSWIIDREQWRQEAVEIRDRFDANKNLTDRRVIARVLDEGEKEFMDYRHPNPYIPPESPGGCKYERNIPPPLHVLQMFPEEEQWLKEMTDWANGKD